MARHIRTTDTRGKVSRGKVLVTLAVLAVGATAVGAGTYSAFTASTSQALTVSSGTESLGFNPTNRLSVTASGIVPGDTIQREVDVKNTGDQTLTAITLTTTATATSLLDSDTTNGLQMVIDKCSQAWTESGTAPAYTYTCGGTPTTNYVSTRPVIQAGGITLTTPAALAVGGTDYLRVTLTFPSTAGDTLQNKSSTINFAFTGTQRGATNK